MPYQTGTASSRAALLTALQTFCTDNGWTLSGNVLHKGTCYASVGLTTSSGSRPANSHLTVQAGNGLSGTTLTDAAPDAALLGLLRNNTTGTYPEWDFPVTFHLFMDTDPDEVYLVVTYGGGGEFVQWLAFGQSPSPGNPGTGNWHAASIPSVYSGNPATTAALDRCWILTNGGALFINDTFAPLPFWITGGNSNVSMSSRMHGCFDETTLAGRWDDGACSANDVGTAQARVNASITNDPLFALMPNAWNSQTLLLPLQVLTGRFSSKRSLVLELGHFRLVRVDFYNNGDIITLGTDKWKVFAAYNKNTAERNGADAGRSHSGTLGFAIRYDGP